MLTKPLAALGRHHRAAFALGLAATTVYLTAHIWIPDLTDRASRALLATSTAISLLGLVAIVHRRPRAFQVRPDRSAFVAPASSVNVLLLLGLLPLVVYSTVSNLRDARNGEAAIDPLLALVLPSLLVVAVAGRWRGTGIELTPAGIRDRGVLGALVVPWDAQPVVPLPGPGDNRTTLPVRYAHPDLVRRRGLALSRRLGTDSLDPQFTARVLRHYATHPGHRSAIGTHAEHHRLLAEIHDPPPQPADGTA